MQFAVPGMKNERVPFQILHYEAEHVPSQRLEYVVPLAVPVLESVGDFILCEQGVDRHVEGLEREDAVVPLDVLGGLEELVHRL